MVRVERKARPRRLEKAKSVPKPAKQAPKARAAKKRRAPTLSRVAKPPRDPLETIRDLERKVRRLRSARRTLEKRLTAAVQEIGALRQFEIRVLLLEEQLHHRDAEVATLRQNGVEAVTGP